MVMIEFDTFELNELQKENLSESLRQKIDSAVRINNVGDDGMVLFNGTSFSHKTHKMGSVSKRYLDKVKELLPSQDRNDVEKILIAGQKTLSTFDECDKSYISRYLSSLGASSPDKLGRVLNSAISGKKDPEREIDQRNEGR